MYMKDQNQQYKIKSKNRNLIFQKYEVIFI